MARSKSWWSAGLLSMGGTRLIRNIKGNDGRTHGRYNVSFSVTLDREPGRVVYCEMDSAKARRMAGSLIAAADYTDQLNSEGSDK